MKPWIPSLYTGWGMGLAKTKIINKNLKESGELSFFFCPYISILPADMDTDYYTLYCQKKTKQTMKNI